jgi:TRAP-type C4-dicarboxylate transport system permease small subunit
MRHLMYRLADACALAGGIALSLVILMTCVSIAGRALTPVGLGPVPGDYELVEAGMAFAVFCFLPMCQVQGGHATVDIFTSQAGPRLNRLLLAVWEVVLAAVTVFIAWRLFAGFLGKLGNGETSMFLQYPVWVTYAAALVPAVLGAVVGLWSAADRVMASVTGHDSRPVAEAQH